MSRADRLEAKAERLAEKADKASMEGKTQKELRLQEKWERADARAQRAR